MAQTTNSNLAGISRPITIVPYQSVWPNLFEQEAAHIQAAVGNFTTTIEHIGSTSVPRLGAKPIIDILVGLKSLGDAPHFVALLIELGYRYFPEHEAAIPERRYFSKILDDNHGYHLHMVEPESLFFKRHLAFRDYLRSHPDTANEYDTLKRDLSKRFGSDREGYVHAKTDFIQRIERLALYPESE
jgi:GrpB-like predicted nucleotidyltransferase (UPF0157 family)